jgi:hypothetical protein
MSEVRTKVSARLQLTKRIDSFLVRGPVSLEGGHGAGSLPCQKPPLLCCGNFRPVA